MLGKDPANPNYKNVNNLLIQVLAYTLVSRTYVYNLCTSIKFVQNCQQIKGIQHISLSEKIQKIPPSCQTTN